MAGKWKDITLNARLFTNVRESALRKASAALENGFPNEAGGISRFPGLRSFCTLAGAAPTYLSEWDGDLVAVTNSRVYRVDSQAVKTDVTGAPVSGDGRVIFDETDNELVMAAGGPIVRMASSLTEILSPDAPEATHVGYIDGFLLANEKGSGRFFHSNSEEFRVWDPLSVFAANGKPDDINALLVTNYREVILTGPDSTEQYERISTGTAPFYRRWSNGLGIIAPYTVLTEDQGTWGISDDYELVRITGQISEPRSDDIGRSFEEIEDWTGAWGVAMKIAGQSYILVQIPNAVNVYGTKGITLLYDIRQKRWCSLYGWDADNICPTRWPGWSYYRMWNRHFVGGNGKILELTEDEFNNDGAMQRLLHRTAHLDEWGRCSVDNVRMRVVRGQVGANATPPLIELRAIRDNNRPTRWIQKSLGAAGQKDMFLEFGPLGEATSWQFEWRVTTDCKIDVVRLQAQINPSEQS